MPRLQEKAREGIIGIRKCTKQEAGQEHCDCWLVRVYCAANAGRCMAGVVDSGTLTDA